MIDFQPYHERELLNELAAGSEAAFHTLFNTYRDKLYTYIFKLSDSSEMAEDIVHDVFLKIWQNRERLSQIENLSAYLYSMTRNHALSGFRRMAKETLILAEITRQQEAATAIDVEDQVAYREVAAFIHESVEKLTPQQRLVFMMSRQQHLKLAVIAEQLGITERTVKNHIAEALRFLRQEIGRKYGPHAIILFVLHQLSSTETIL